MAKSPTPLPEIKTTKNSGPASGSSPVTAGNFTRAETDRTFAGFVALRGFDNFHDYRDLAPREQRKSLL